MDIVLLLLNHNFVHNATAKIRHNHGRKDFLLHEVIFFPMQICKSYSVFQFTERRFYPPYADILLMPIFLITAVKT